MADAFFCLHLHHSVHRFVFCILYFLIVCDVLLRVGRFDAFLEENDKYYHVFFDSDS